ncbi:MAG: cytochrome c oxidase assembly protein [Solirubrobacteraceae bacterium]
MRAPSLPGLFVSHWHVSWSLIAIGALYGALYLWAAITTGRWPVRRTFAFLAGIACVLVALQSGTDTYDDRLLSVHMVQHMLLLLVAPLLFLAGRPALLSLRALPPGRSRRGLARALQRAAHLVGPVPCLAAFSAVVVLTHVPGFYSATLRSSALHGFEHVVYLCAGLLLWAPLLDVDPSPRRRLGGFGRLIYMLGAMPAMALVGAYLNRHPSLVYPAYGPPAHALGISAIADQQQAGAIMWVAGNLIMIAVGLWAALAAMVAEERRQQSREARAIPGASS